MAQNSDANITWSRKKRLRTCNSPRRLLLYPVYTVCVGAREICAGINILTVIHVVVIRVTDTISALHSQLIAYKCTSSFTTQCTHTRTCECLTLYKMKPFINIQAVVYIEVYVCYCCCYQL